VESGESPVEKATGKTQKACPSFLAKKYVISVLGISKSLCAMRLAPSGFAVRDA